MVIISSREFRQHQKEYFERVDNGEHIIVQRGKDKAYALTPITPNDMYFNAAMLKRLKDSLEQIENGENVEFSSSKEISELLGL